MKIFYAEDKDKEYIKKLWQYSFTDDERYVEYYFKKRYKKENNLLLKDGETIRSSLQINPYKIIFFKSSQMVSYIVGISSLPEDRGKGYTSFLIKETLKHLYSKGEVLSLLMPIDTNIYTRYGFSNICDIAKLTIPLDRIKKYKSLNSKIIRYENKNQINDLIEIYKSSSKDWKIYVDRDEDYYIDFIDEVELEGGLIFIEYIDNIPNSYMVFYPKYELGKKGYIREILSKNSSGVKSLLNIAKNHYTQIKECEVDLPKNSTIPYILDNDNKIEYKKIPFMMARVVNVSIVLEILLKKLKFLVENLKIKITDSIIKENDKVFCITNNLLNIGQTDYDIEIDILDFTSLVSGYMSLDDFLFKNSIEIDNKVYKNFKTLLIEGVNYFNDYV